MNTKIKILLFVISFFSAGHVVAASYSVSFPSFAGNYVYPKGSAQASFDLGVHFSSIQSATLTIEASGTAGLAQLCILDEPECTSYSYGQDLIWGFASEEAAQYPLFGAQSLTNNIVSYTFNITSQSSFLLDGAGKIYIEPNFLVTVPEWTLTILQPSSYKISNVVLNVEGSVVPVPSTFYLLLSGLTSLLGLSSKLRKHKLTDRS